MSVKNILFNKYSDLIDVELPHWLDQEIKDDNSTIKSYVWKTEKLRRIRLSELNIKNKFIAESLVIYPDFQYLNPIFGTEFVACSDKKYFGTIDFHPLKMDKEYENEYILPYLSDQPDRVKNVSKVYDLDKYFSKKLWLKNTDNNFYEEYLTKLDLYLERYNDCIKKCGTGQSHIFQIGYDHHLSYTDPAYGILKSYYDKEFARKYINNFLFDLA
jgi:hypothetical protein